MDTNKEVAYTMNEDPPHRGSLTEELKQQIYKNSASIELLEKQVGNVEDFRNSVASVKDDMRILRSGVTVDMAGLKSLFISKLKQSEAATAKQFAALDTKVDNTNNGQKTLRKILYWVLGFTITVLIAIPGTLTLGISATNASNVAILASQEKNQHSFEKNIEEKIDLIAVRASLRDSAFQNQLIEISKSLKSMKDSMKK